MSAQVITDLLEAAAELTDLANDEHDSHRCPRTGRCDAHLEDRIARLRELAQSCRNTAEMLERMTAHLLPAQEVAA